MTKQLLLQILLCLGSVPNPQKQSRIKKAGDRLPIARECIPMPRRSKVDAPNRPETVDELVVGGLVLPVYIVTLVGDAEHPPGCHSIPDLHVPRPPFPIRVADQPILTPIGAGLLDQSLIDIWLPGVLALIFEAHPRRVAVELHFAVVGSDEDDTELLRPRAEVVRIVDRELLGPIRLFGNGNVNTGDT